VTRYFCDDVSHWRDGEPRVVDVTPQVRLELGYTVDREAYGADVHDVIDRVQRLDESDRARRRAEIRRILTGSSTPSGAPVRLVEGTAGRTSDVIRVPDAEPRPTAVGAVTTRASVQTDVGAGLSGTYAADELASRLAAAPRTADDVADAIRRTPAFETRTADRVGHPWRVVITCPVGEGDPPTEHRVVFAGTGGAEQLDVFGIPASAWDLALESTASTDLVPSRGSRRAERLLGWLLLFEIVAALALAVTTWTSGGLGMAAREAPGWLLFAVVLGLGALAFAAIGLFGPRSPDGNVNDTLVVRDFYASRSEMLWIATAVSIALFIASVAVAFAGPLASDDGAIPTPAISFAQSDGRQAALIDLDASGVGIDDAPTVTIRSFSTHTDPGTTIGVVTATGAADGRLAVHDVIGVPAGADFLAVIVSVAGNGPSACSPLGADDAGCSVVAVPQASRGAATPVTGIGPGAPTPSTTPGTATSPSAAVPSPVAPTSSLAPTTSFAPTTSLAPSPSAAATVASP
jgi:hypothetical protein